MLPVQGGVEFLSNAAQDGQFVQAQVQVPVNLCVELGVFDGDGGLIGKEGQQFYFVIVKGRCVSSAIKIQRAQRLAAADQRGDNSPRYILRLDQRSADDFLARGRWEQPGFNSLLFQVGHKLLAREALDQVVREAAGGLDF